MVYSGCIMIKLTNRQLECVALAAEGMDYNETAKAINVSQPMVQAHLTRARKRLNAKNTTHAVAIAIKKGII